MQAHTITITTIEQIANLTPIEIMQRAAAALAKREREVNKIMDDLLAFRERIGQPEPGLRAAQVRRSHALALVRRIWEGKVVHPREAEASGPIADKLLAMCMRDLYEALDADDRRALRLVTMVVQHLDQAPHVRDEADYFAYLYRSLEAEEADIDPGDFLRSEGMGDLADFLAE